MIRANKYHAKPREADGYRFASGAEYARYIALRLQEIGGHIHNLQVHPPYRLFASTSDRKGEIVVGAYTPDFVYGRYLPDGDYEQVVEDVKGGNATRTEAYRLRKRIWEANTGLTITEVEG